MAGGTTGRSQLVCPCLPSSINRCLRLVFGMAGWPHALPTPLNWNWVGPCWFRPKQAKKQLKLEGKKKEIVPRFRLRDPMLQPGVGIPSLTHFCLILANSAWCKIKKKIPHRSAAIGVASVCHRPRRRRGGPQHRAATLGRPTHLQQEDNK